jgi:hypothetical protein
MIKKEGEILPFFGLESETAIQKVQAFDRNHNVSRYLVNSLNEIVFEFLNVLSFERVCSSD